LSLLGDCDLAALDQPGAAMVVGTLKLAVGEKTGWFAGSNAAILESGR